MKGKYFLDSMLEGTFDVILIQSLKGGLERLIY